MASGGLWTALGASARLWKLGASGGLGRRLGASASPWGPLGVPGGLWERLGAHGDLWRPLGVSGNLWESLAASAGVLMPLGAPAGLWRPLRASGRLPASLLVAWRCKYWWREQQVYNKLGWEKLTHECPFHPRRWEDQFATTWITDFSGFPKE